MILESTFKRLKKNISRKFGRQSKSRKDLKSLQRKISVSDMLLEKVDSKISILSPLKEENEQIETNQTPIHRTDRFKMKNSPKLNLFKSTEKSCTNEFSRKFIPRITKLKLNLDIPENELTVRESEFCQQKRTDNQMMTMMEFLSEERNELEKTISIEELNFTEDAINDLMNNQSNTPERFREKSDLLQNFSVNRSSTKKANSPRLFSKENKMASPSAYRPLGHVGFSPNMKSADVNENPGFEIMMFRGNSRKQKLNGVSQFSCDNEGTKIQSIDHFSPICEPSFPKKKCRTILEYDKIRTLDFSPNEGIKPKNQRNFSIVPTEKNYDSSEENLVERNVVINSSDPRESINMPMDPDYDIMNQSSSTDSSLNEPIKNKFFLQFRHLRLPLEKLGDFYEWLSRKIFSAMKKAYQSAEESFTVIPPKSKTPSNAEEEDLPRIISKMRSENEKILSLISKNINHLTDEMIEACKKNEMNFSVLTKEVEGMKKLSEKLIEDNSSLVKQLKKLSEVVGNIRSSSNVFPAPTPKTSSFASPMLEISAPPPPPPPMPEVFTPVPPPPPMPPLFSITPKTPSFKSSPRTPTRKRPKPLESRPQITVEDLLKVTLKKAPQSQKENRRYSLPAGGAHGPAISLDMLRSVKLKSARRSSIDGVKSPGRVPSYKSRNRLSLSPMTAGNENTPLGRILRHVDSNRRRSIGAMMMSPTRSRDRERTKENPNKNNSPRRNKTSLDIK